MLAATISPAGLAPGTPTTPDMPTMPGTPKPPPTPTTTTTVIVGTGTADFLYRLLQTLINMANAQLARSRQPSAAAIVVDGRLDLRTLKAFMPVSRAVGGTLAIVDFTPDPKYLATNADAFARGIAKWLGLTWVEAPGVPGHWERMRVGQTVPVLPSLPAPPAPPIPAPAPALCPPGLVATSRGCLPAPSTTPTMPSTTSTTTQPPTQPPPPVRVDIGPTVVTPETTPPPGMLTPSQARYAGCIARFNKTRNVFAIYCPVGSTAATPGLGLYDEDLRCLYGECGLGADPVTPPVPAGFVKTAEVTTLPHAGETPAGDEQDKFFRANNPAMWFLIIGTAAAIGGGSYWFIRRRQHKPSSFGAACPKGQTWLESRGVCVDAKAYWDNPKRVLRKLGPRKRAA